MWDCGDCCVCCDCCSTYLCLVSAEALGRGSRCGIHCATATLSHFKNRPRPASARKQFCLSGLTDGPTDRPTESSTWIRNLRSRPASVKHLAEQLAHHVAVHLRIARYTSEIPVAHLYSAFGVGLCRTIVNDLTGQPVDVAATPRAPLRAHLRHCRRSVVSSTGHMLAPAV